MLTLTDLALPVVAAPMAGGPSSPALVAAVSDACGLGFLAAGYKKADAVEAEIAAVRKLTDAPFGVNLFVIPPVEVDPASLDGYRARLEPEASRLGVELGEPRWEDDDWDAKLALMLRVRPAVVSFAFGCPSAADLAALAAEDILTMVTVTSVDEAVRAQDAGAGALAVQGPDAGGHRSTWDPAADPNPTPLLELLADVVAAVDVPVVAAGGLMTAEDTQAVLDRGAVAAQFGTAFMLADEAGTGQLLRDAFGDPEFSETRTTRAFTGRWARGLANRFMAENEDAPAAYPHLHHLTSPLRRAGFTTGDADVAHLWAGTGWREAQSGPAAEIAHRLAP